MLACLQARRLRQEEASELYAKMRGQAERMREAAANKRRLREQAAAFFKAQPETDPVPEGVVLCTVCYHTAD